MRETDRAALKASLDQIVVRHESLRTRIEVVDGQGVQRIDAQQIGFALKEGVLGQQGQEAGPELLRLARQRSALRRPLIWRGGH